MNLLKQYQHFHCPS